MIIKFDESQSPVINTNHGKSYIVSVDLHKPYIETSSQGLYATDLDTKIWVNVVYSVIDHGWHPSNFMVGRFQLSFISRILGDFEIKACKQI